MQLELDRQLITNEELAEICRVSLDTIFKWRFEKTGPPGFRLGRRVVYKLSDVYAWMDHRYETDKGR